MGVVVLDLDRRRGGGRGVIAREPGGVVVGVAVHRDRGRLVLEQHRVQPEVPLVLVERGGVVEIALVLRQDRVAARHQAERGLAIAAVREQLGAVLEAGRELDRRGGVAARAAHHADRAVDHADHGVVDAVGDRPVVDERVAGDAGQPARGVRLVDRLRLVGQVAAGHHDRPIERAQDQVVERGRRQHEAERREAGRDRLGQPLGPGRGEQDDRRLGAREHGGLDRVGVAVAADHVERARHHRQRLAIAVLGRAQPRDRLGAGRVARQVIAAEALDRDDLALEDQAAGRVDVVDQRDRRGARGVPAVAHQARAGPARVARDRLGVEPAVGRILVLRGARRAQREAGQGRRGAIVGHAGHDRQARAAVGAGRERIAIAPPERIEHLGRARRADRRVGGDLGARRPSLAREDLELGGELAEVLPRLDALDARERRRLLAEPRDEQREHLRLAARADQQALAVVLHLADHAELARELPHRRAEPDALHPAADPDLDAQLRLGRAELRPGIERVGRAPPVGPERGHAASQSSTRPRSIRTR